MRNVIVSAAALLAAACGSESGSGNRSEAGKAGAGNSSAAAGGGGSAAPALQAGEWEMTTQVLSMNIPNMPKGMSPPLPQPTTVRTCVTPEQAANPSGGFLTGSGDDGGCTSENVSMSGGRIQATVQCRAETGTMRSTINGEMSATSYAITQQVETSAQGMTMEMESRTTGRRIGDCPAR